MLKRREAPRDEAYEAFAQAVYAAFGDRRKLHGGETVLAYEGREQLKLPAEVVLMLIQHMICLLYTSALSPRRAGRPHRPR